MDKEGQTAGATPGAPGPAFVKALEDLLVTLRRSSKDLAFYPQGHPQLNRSLERALSELRAAVDARAPLQFTVSRTGFGFDGRPVGHENRQLATMAAELFVRRIQQIFFTQGIEAAELAAFLRVITSDPKQLAQQGGPGKVLAVQRVARIQVNEFDFRRLGGAAAPAGRGTGPAGTGAQGSGGSGTGVGRSGAGPGGPGTSSGAAAGAASASARMPSDAAQAALTRGAQGAESGEAGSSQTTEAKEEAGSEAADALLASLSARKEQREQTVEGLIERLEEEANSGGQAGYEWVASRLEAAAGQAIRDDRLEDVLAILRVFLQHREADGLKPAVRERAAQAVEAVVADDAVEYLVEHLGVSAEGSAEDLSGMLVGLGPRVIPPLLERLTRSDQGTARAALVASLARFLEVAQSEVTHALQQADRDQAAQLSLNIGEVGGEAGAALLACLVRHRNAQVRCDALRGLGRIGGASVHRHLMQALRDPDPAVLEVAIGFVGTTKVKLATPTLLRLAGQRALTGQAFAVRKAAVAALGAMGDPGSVAILSGLLRTRTWFMRAAGDELRQTAALALLAMARPEARQVVEAGVRSRRGDVRRACDAALKTLAAAAPGQG